MSIHSCNEFCQKDTRLHVFQKNERELELGFSSKAEIIAVLLERMKEYQELLSLLN